MNHQILAKIVGGDLTDSDLTDNGETEDKSESIALNILDAFANIETDVLTTLWSAMYARVSDAYSETEDEAYLTSQNDLLYGYLYSIDYDMDTKTDYYFVDGTQYVHDVDDDLHIETYTTHEYTYTYKSYFENSYTFDFSEVFDRAKGVLNVDGEPSLNNINYDLIQDENTLDYTLNLYYKDSYAEYTFTYVTSVDYSILALGYTNTDKEEGKEYYAKGITLNEVESIMLDFDSSLWDEKETPEYYGLEFALTSDENGYYVSGYDMNLNQKIVYIPEQYSGKPVVSIGKPEGTTTSNAVFSGGSSTVNYLQEVVIPDSVTTIAPYAFYQSYGLSKITIPASVMTIGDYAFRNCNGLKSVTLQEGLTYIGIYAFYQCYSLKSVYIPNTVTEIGNQAFYQCLSLSTIEIPSSVTALGTQVFGYCQGLLSASISGSVKTIGTSMFNACLLLRNVTLGEGITEIANSAFSGCYALETITLPSTLTAIGTTVFGTCYSLNSIFIPKSLTSIGNTSFNNCYSLSSVYYEGTETAWNDINIGSESNTFLEIATKYYNCSEIGDESNVEYVSNVDDFTFQLSKDEESYAVTKYDASSNVDKAIEIPSEYNGKPVTAIGNPEALSIDDSIIGGLMSTNYVQYVIVPESVSTIYPYAFANTYALKEIDIKGSVLEIPNNTFQNCYSLQKVKLNSDINSIGASAFSKCYSLREFTLSAPLSSIGANAFEYCGLEEAILPSGLIQIGDKAFQYCSALRYAYIPNSIENFGDSIFSYCYALSSVNLESGITTIGDHLFSGCYGSPLSKIPEGVETIETYAFYMNYGLTSLVIPTSVLSIGASAFNLCYALTEIFYEGSAEQWRQIDISSSGTSNAFLTTYATKYFYDEDGSAFTSDPTGNYWHYVDGEPTIWVTL